MEEYTISHKKVEHRNISFKFRLSSEIGKIDQLDSLDRLSSFIDETDKK